jgi:hypothetical protein
MRNETLNFVRVARESKDSHSGFLYIHTWATGHQRLIFSSKEAAETWIENQNQKATSD